VSVQILDLESPRECRIRASRLASHYCVLGRLAVAHVGGTQYCSTQLLEARRGALRSWKRDSSDVLSSSWMD